MLQIFVTKMFKHTYIHTLCFYKVKIGVVVPSGVFVTAKLLTRIKEFSKT